MHSDLVGRSVVLLLGVALMFSIVMIIDVQLRLSAMDIDDPSTWPNMAPQMVYLFIPIVFIPIAILVVFVDSIAGYVMKKQPTNLKYWFVLGVLYGSAFSFIPISRNGFPLSISVPICALIFFGLPVLIRLLQGGDRQLR